MAFYIGGTAVVDTVAIEYVTFPYVGGDGAGGPNYHVGGIYVSGHYLVIPYDNNCNCNCNC